jgi:hypothetical protein
LSGVPDRHDGPGVASIEGMATPSERRAVSPLHGLWLSVFAIDASLAGRGHEHQLGALGLGLLFSWLIVSELLSSRRAASRPFGELE